jgi:hypothetical protein
MLCRLPKQLLSVAESTGKQPHQNFRRNRYKHHKLSGLGKLCDRPM